MRTTKKTALTLALVALSMGLQACSSGTPVAPPGTILTISASSTRISINGTVEITVVGRKPDGNRLASGTEITFSTSLGRIEGTGIALTDNLGMARAILAADGRSGTATVTATTGDGSAMATLDIVIGESSDSRPVLILSVNPDNIPVGDATATITITARNADGTQVASGTVILTTTLGDLDPERPQVQAGTATSILTAGPQAGTATITAILGASDPETTTLTIRDAATDVSVQADPRNIPQAGATVTLTAFVTNSQGQGFQGAPVTFDSERGSLQINGVVFTNSSGVASNTLTVSQDQIQDLASGQSFLITATTPRGDGLLISATTTIRIQ